MAFVSVVVPAFNEERRIGSTLEALLAQSYPARSYEVVVVDNGSTDGTRRAVAAYPVRCLREPRRSSYAARNTGIQATSGEYLAFIDSDCIAESSWLENLILRDRECGQGLVAGRIELAAPARPTMGSVLLGLRFSAQARQANVEERCAAPGGNLLIKRAVFAETGLFDVAVSGADSELTKAAAQRGRKIAYAHDAVVWHPADISNLDFLRRSFRIHYSDGVRMRGEPGALLQLWRQLPWRPPLRLPRALREAGVRAASPWRRCGWLAYLWFDSLSRWAGDLCGILGMPYRGDRR